MEDDFRLTMTSFDVGPAWDFMVNVERAYRFREMIYQLLFDVPYQANFPVACTLQY